MYVTEQIKYSLSEEERLLDEEIKELEKKIRDVQAQYDKLFRTKPKKLKEIKEKENTLIELDRQSRYYSNQRNKLLECLYRKETI